MLRILCLLLVGVAAIQPVLQAGRATEEKHDLQLLATNAQAENEMSATVTCIIMLIFVYYFVHSTVGLIKMWNQYTGVKISGALDIIESGADIVNVAPMITVLFLACRLRAVYLANSAPVSLLQVDPGKYGLPDKMTQTFMYTASGCLVAQLGLQILMPVLTGASGLMSGMAWLAGLLTALRELANVGVNVGVAYVIYAVCSMKAPTEIWGETEPPVSPAVMATMLLVVTYMTFFVIADIIKNVAYFTGAREEEETGAQKFAEVLKGGLHTMNLAPMCAVLFLATRLRAISMGRSGPQEWAQNCFYGVSAGVLFAALMTVMGPLVLGSKARRGVCDEDVIYEFSNPIVSIVFQVARYVSLVCIYAGLTAIVVSVFTIEPAAGRSPPPISVAMMCIIGLTTAFFGSYIGVWLFTTIKQYNFGSDTLTSLYNLAISMFDNSKTAMQMAPMACILFFGARLRAMQITQYQGGPQFWAQCCMHLTAWSIVFGAGVAFLQPALVGSSDDVGKAEASGFWWFVSVLRVLATLSVFGGTLAVVVSLFLITPENASSFSEHAGHAF